MCAIDRSPEGENPLADVGLEVRSVLTRADLDAVAGTGWVASAPREVRPGTVVAILTRG